MRWSRPHPFLKIGPLVSELVFALGNIFGQFRGFTIALEAQGDGSGVLCSDQHMSAKTGLGLKPLFIPVFVFVIAALALPMKRVTIDQVIAGTKIITPGRHCLRDGEG
jgi:hypothetical protein